jgi:hypothetical protein
MAFTPKIPGKYRRAFNWRLSYGDQQPTRKSDAQAMARLATSDFPDILEDFLEISRKRQKNWTALSRLQLHMLEELLVQEAAVKHYRDALSKLGASSESGKGEPEESQEGVFARQQLFFFRLYANAIRSIGDGIAWRALGFDRAVTRLMSERETKQHLTSEGTAEELREWSYHFESGTGLAILNALTNCLAIGDVTVVREDGSVEIVEVKSSNTKSGRKVRQKHRMSEVVTLLDSGAGENENREVRIEILPITPETGLDQIEELLQSASKTGVAAKRISNCLYVEAVDLLAMDDAQTLQKKADSLRDQVVGEWSRRGDFVVDMNSFDTMAFTPNCAPFSVFPFKPRTCVDLLIGSKFYTTYLNENAVAKEFENRGWTVEKTSEQLLREGDTEAVMLVSKGNFHARIPPADFMRLQTEAMRPKTLIQAYEIKYKEGNRGEEGYLLALYSGEPEVWR